MYLFEKIRELSPILSPVFLSNYKGIWGHVEYGRSSTKQTNKNEKKKTTLVWDVELNSMLHLEYSH